NNSVFTASGTRPSGRVNVVNNTVDVLKERQQMVADVQKVAGNPDPTYDDVQKIKTMQQNWKRMGQIPREQSKPLTASFYTACSLINEKYFINKIAESQHEAYANLDEKQRLQIKLQIVRDLLARDQSELETFQEN